jgi:hypothetical protein
MIDIEAGETAGSEDIRPNPAILIGGAAAIGLISALSLPWPVAVASTVLGTLMVAGAEVDARKFLLPDPVTWGAVRGDTIVFRPCDQRRTIGRDVCTPGRRTRRADDEDTLRCVSVSRAVDRVLCGQRDAIIRNRDSERYMNSL